MSHTTRVILDVYGWGFFFSFFYFVYAAGLHREELEKLHATFGAKVFAVLVATAVWFITVPYMLGETTAVVIANRRQKS